MYARSNHYKLFASSASVQYIQNPSDFIQYFEKWIKKNQNAKNLSIYNVTHTLFLLLVLENAIEYYSKPLQDAYLSNLKSLKFGFTVFFEKCVEIFPTSNLLSLFEKLLEYSDDFYELSLLQKRYSHPENVPNSNIFNQNGLTFQEEQELYQKYLTLYNKLNTTCIQNLCSGIEQALYDSDTTSEKEDNDFSGISEAIKNCFFPNLTDNTFQRESSRLAM